MSQFAPAPSISIAGNVEGSIVVGDHNFVVNTNYGTIVYKQAGQQVKLREFAPRPPRPPRGFIGRQRELTILSQKFNNREAVLIEGADGIGKTTLLKKAANLEGISSNQSGVLFTEGIDQDGSALSWNDLLQFFFDALFESDPALKVTLASARSYLSNTTPLVLLDRIKLPIDGLESLLDLFPQASVVITADKPTSTEAFESIRLGPLSTDTASQLLADKAGIPLEEANRTDLEKICALLNGVPLALVTIGNAIREQDISLEQVLQDLERIQPEAVQPIQAGIERTYRYVQSFLNEDERQMLALTAAVPGISASRPWLESLAGGAEVSQRMERLGLLQANSPRLRLHPEYAAYALEGFDVNQIRGQLVETLLGALKSQKLDFQFVRAELGNLLGLVDWASNQQRWLDVIALGQALDPYLTLRGLWDGWNKVLEQALSAARVLGDRFVEGWALHQLGTREIGVGDPAHAVDLLRQALELRRAIGDDAGAAYTQHNLDLLIPPPPPNPPPGRGPSSRRRFFSIGLILLVFLSISSFAVTSYYFPERTGFSRILSYFATKPANLLPDTGKLQTSTPVPSSTPSSTPSPLPTLTPTATLTETPTDTPTPTSTPTQTQTPTTIPTPTETLTPTSQVPMVTVLQQAYCQYGPGSAYLPAGDLFPGDVGEVNGRNAAKTWLFIKVLKNNRYCWVSGILVQVTGDLSRIQVQPEILPHTTAPYTSMGVQATRSGNTVTVTWNQVQYNFRDGRGYMLEVNLCQKAAYITMAVHTNDLSYVFTDEKTCTAPSSGKIYVVDVQGYSPPETIPWP
ncbi:MAG TPA: hypothetical protein VF498_02660 [Anaerolineales bacterium]